MIFLKISVKHGLVKYLYETVISLMPWNPWKPYELNYMCPHFMLLLSIYVLYSNVTYIYPVSCLVEIKLFQTCATTVAALMDFPRNSLSFVKICTQAVACVVKQLVQV